jgi:hypothetical protein
LSGQRERDAVQMHKLVTARTRSLSWA